MAFDLGAFIAGASQGAASSIESRNKEIRNAALREFDMLQKQAVEQEEKLRTRRDNLKATAEVLSSYRGLNNQGFTQAQIVGLLQNPTVAKRVAEQLKENEDGLDQIDFSKLYTITKGNADITPDEYIKQTTAIAIPTTEAPQPVVRGAFGLESPAYRQAQAEFESASGRTLKEIRAFAQGPAGFEGERIEGVMNFSQFKKPETLATITGRLRDNIANGEDLNAANNKKLLAQLAANAVIEAKFSKDGEGDKPRTAAQINTVFNQSLRVALDPFIVKGVVRFDPNANDYIPISGDAESINSFTEQKTKVIEAQSRQLGILDKDNNIVGGRNARDALLPYANIEGNKVVGWKRPATPEATTVPTVPGRPGVAPTPAEVLPLPKTQDNKLDGTKLVIGRQYRAADGTVRTWNGTGWQ